ncbi:DEAD/DEAH box helicase [Amphibacillus sp. Q70]|uniref:DEAD/DEAH box helicase n=1 Tax=Amphibacillus sp. Q70 TaxID=3453416 RepID=UPI003F87CD59
MEKHHFKEFNVKPWINEIVEQLGFRNPTPIQHKVIPAVLRNESIMGQSQTGSGKTHAFLLPLFNQLSFEKKEVQFVVTAPTRELATQIFTEVKKIISFLHEDQHVTAKLFIGGTDKKRMIEKLTEQPQIIVATPGRLLDLIKEGSINLYTARSFVIDEADLMLELGLINEIDQMLVKANPATQVLVFSATIPERLQPFLKKYLHNPTYFQITDQMSPIKIENRLIPLRHRKPAEVITRIAKTINPYLAIIFANGKEACDDLYAELLDQGLNVGLIHGGLGARERKRVLKDIQALKYQYIVATDLAARGIDIKGVSHVINAQLPKEVEFFIHRVGRTARAGMEGTAIHLYTDQDIHLLNKLVEQGTEFETFDIVKDEWKEIAPWNERKLRKRQSDELDQEAWKRVKKPKKVKPGYKVKMKRQQEKIKRQLKQKRKK